MRFLFFLMAAVGMMAHGPALAAEPIRLHAAGSLRAALIEVGAAFTRETGLTVQPVFGASGLLRDRLGQGEASDVFASANMEHPQALAATGKAGPVVVFARNRLCALTRPGLIVAPDALLDRMLDPAIKLGTSTPRADPSGDYAWALFARAEAVRPGSRSALETKALKLVASPGAPPPPADRSVYGMLLQQGAADIFLTYCTNGLLAKSEVLGLSAVALPDSLAVGADYGLTIMAAARQPEASRFAMYVLSPAGQSILARFGFEAPTAPRF